MKIKCDIEPRITLTPIEFIKMLELDYEKLSSNDKKKICDVLILHPLNSPPYSAPAKYVTFFSFIGSPFCTA